MICGAGITGWKPRRPIVFPENAWHEILPPEQIQCTDAIARDWELVLRQQNLLWPSHA